ncbi:MULTISPECIES: sulfite exporter TauE/SafE family protein [Calditerrivibrio]|uniref:sulfite exporter TauE/SafE family protein n=1 Tax=Calditerrivibrio TaxID=545865 RepID=UPI003C7860F1
MNITVSVLSFILSFVFALGGVGSGVVLVPIMFSLGIPINEAKPTGLFINTTSLSAASFSNIKHKRVDFKLGMPIIISSMLLAPVGAYLSLFINKTIVMIIFIVFLLFSSGVMIFFNPKKYEDKFRDDRPLGLLVFTGIIAGLLSGLLGIGAGSLISPLLVVSGFNPKKVVTITALVVPFSSLTGFLAYLKMGHVNIQLLIFAGLAAYLGGYLGTHFMHLKMKPMTVKRFLGIIVFLIAVDLIIKLFK